MSIRADGKQFAAIPLNGRRKTLRALDPKLPPLSDYLPDPYLLDEDDVSTST